MQDLAKMSQILVSMSMKELLSAVDSFSLGHSHLSYLLCGDSPNKHNMKTIYGISGREI